jgi:hypothetical protein
VRTRRPTGISSHDPPALRRGRIRALVLRTGLVAISLLLLGAAAASARNLETQEKALLPQGSIGVVVIDLSLSIADEDYNVVRGALRRLIEEDARVGLVVFSDVPYELLPPGTPASEMQPMLRLLVPPRLGPPINPWTQTFRAGTRISTAVALAQGMLERDRVEDGAILLVSDLETAPDDVGQLARTIAGLRRSDIELRVFGLAPSSDARAIFGGLLEDEAFAVPLSSDDPIPLESEARHRLPTFLLLLGGLVFLALGLHERFAGRLGLPRTQGGAP